MRLPQHAFFILAPALALTLSACGQSGLPAKGHATLLSAADAQLNVRRAKTGHLLVPAQVNGQDAGWFILDTGAGMSCISRQAAEILGLPAGGQVRAQGNAGSQATRFRHVHTLGFGPVRLTDTLLVELDLDAVGKSIGEDIRGVIGYECFFAGVFEIDPLAPSVSVRSAATYTPPAGADWHALDFINRRPHIQGKVERHPPMTFLLDLGSREGVALNSPIVRKLSLLDGRETQATEHGGVGGKQPARMGKLSSFSFAGRTLEDVPATFSQATAGLFSQADKAGAIGVQVLGRFRVVLDYEHSRLALVPRN
ncbi:MAG: hypothetical protein C0502_02005 [Opitutus sp.]|nr:hypothetical protein [Opitutus sp.]